MSYTNKGLVEYSKKCLALGNESIYLYGSYGNTLTEAFINQKVKQYAYNVSRQTIYKNCLKSSGTEYAFDCVGLIKSYLWGGYGNVKYNSKQDKSANGMYNAATVKGKMSTMPETEGLLVHMSGHIGVYIGNGYVIECTPSKTFAKQDHKGGGICKTKLTDRKWTGWCECPYITYENKDTKKGYSGTFPSLGLKGYLSKGDKGTQVKRLQEFLNWCIDAKLDVDGSFGPATLKAVKKYQETYKLEVDGYFGPASLKKAKEIKK